MGKTRRLIFAATFVAILVLSSAGAVFGFTGLVVAVPAAAVMKLAYEVLYLKKSFDSGSGGSAAKSPRQNNYGSEKS